MTDVPTPYHRTLLLDDGGDLSFDGSGKLVMTTLDDQKREQDISIYLKTVALEDMFSPTYGFDIIAAKTAPFNKARVEYEIRKTLEQYRNREGMANRIKSVNAVVIGDPSEDRVVAVGISLTADTDSVSTLGVNL